MRVRRGPRGLYYTDGRLDDNYYNDMWAPYYMLLGKCITGTIKDLPMLWEDHLWPGLQGLLFVVILPLIPFLRVYNSRKYARKNFADKYKEEPNFPKDYCEIIE